MSKDQLLAEILRLPDNERRDLIGAATDSLTQTVPDPDMTPELLAELDRRYEDMLSNPNNSSTWEEVRARLQARKKREK